MAQNPAAAKLDPPKKEPPLETFDRTLELVRTHYYDSDMNDLPWDKWVKAHRQKLANADRPGELLPLAVNSVLSGLETSHTVFLSSHDQPYWALKSIFSGDVDGHELQHPGFLFVRKGKRWFAGPVFEGGPAAKAGLRRGDQIVSVNGAPPQPVASFRSAKPNKPVEIEIRRVPWDDPRTIKLKPVKESFQRSMLRATRKSRHIYQADGAAIGYIRLYAGTHAKFREALENAARDFAKTTDAMILDLRDGFGGADPSYLRSFLETGTPGSGKPVYTKPLVALINEGTRSGKEWLAWLVKTKKRGVLVGERTAGAVVSGKPFPIVPGRYLLYLAVGKPSSLPNLEGRGVAPDIQVDEPLMYTGGSDPVLKRGLKEAASRASSD